MNDQALSESGPSKQKVLDENYVPIVTLPPKETITLNMAKHLMWVRMKKIHKFCSQKKVWNLKETIIDDNLHLQ